MNKILGIIPARGGSKGLLRKNILDFLGKPLISYTIEEAKKSKYLNRIIVSTDDIEIAKISMKYGAEVPFIRKKELADDTSSINDVIANVIEELYNSEKYLPDVICLLQCTSPLRTVYDIDNTIRKMFQTNSDSAVSVREARSNPYWTNIFKNDKLEYFIEEGKYISRRQDLPKVYELNGAVYVTKIEAFTKEKKIETENIAGYIMNEENSIDIDSIVDFKMAEFIFSNRKMNKED